MKRLENWVKKFVMENHSNPEMLGMAFLLLPLLIWYTMKWHNELVDEYNDKLGVKGK